MHITTTIFANLKIRNYSPRHCELFLRSNPGFLKLFWIAAPYKKHKAPKELQYNSLIILHFLLGQILGFLHANLGFLLCDHGIVAHNNLVRPLYMLHHFSSY